MASIMNASLLAKLATNFAKCVKGYHLINDDPIKEAPWENINAIILNASGCSVSSQSDGSHRSGADLNCSLGSFSNKSTQFEKNKGAFKVSSYRLTTVCSEKDAGNIENIIEEINNSQGHICTRINNTSISINVDLTQIAPASQIPGLSVLVYFGSKRILLPLKFRYLIGKDE